ncbi:hypothetical protein BU24DRAFT_26186 [Aaosphaeria arxii CBS 175.79]|uniref:Secreted protein n=1 Tax=Aaosphaeria arxii CBS 175.79 TaxID=1450172 RepID=A0A6A5YA82_9PLEO|nr:uncharacterized protein BU24DRAFT_26186 [Aaosphaeria arxii CBS 175.79]KAF2021710.1 hypothetical protein BU24DRAFT_26186 [Aaosphaeria arxii CBS 175.79]
MLFLIVCAISGLQHTQIVVEHLNTNGGRITVNFIEDARYNAQLYALLGVNQPTSCPLSWLRGTPDIIVLDYQQLHFFFIVKVKDNVHLGGFVGRHPLKEKTRCMVIVFEEAFDNVCFFKLMHSTRAENYSFRFICMFYFVCNK